MNISDKFADRVKHLEASAIREIFKLLAKPGIISFAGGAPAPHAGSGCVARRRAAPAKA